MGSRPLTVCLAYYDNPLMLTHQFETMAAYPAEMRAHLDVIVVDDGSPSGPAAGVAVPEGLDVKIFRMVDDVRWNQDACRNLAVDHASHRWLLLTDMDHLIPEKTMRRVMKGELSSGTVYRFSRVTAPAMDFYKPHPNSWLMTRETWDRIGGYDERFAGFYGSDGPFRASVERVAPIVQLEEALIRVPREVVPDASTTTYGRKEPQDKEGIKRIRAAIAEMPEEQRRPMRRGFVWERLR